MYYSKLFPKMFITLLPAMFQRKAILKTCESRAIEHIHTHTHKLIYKIKGMAYFSFVLNTMVKSSASHNVLFCF